MYDWDEEADNLPDVFEQPKLAPQGQDGIAHFSYFDNERQLSFVWDGSYKQHVNVSFGGAGEPVKWTFDFLEVWRDQKVVDTPYFSNGHEMWSAAAHFKAACVDWIKKMESAENDSNDSKPLFRRVFDEMNPNFTRKQEYNHLFVHGVHNYLNQRLDSNGHVFLNEAYDALGMSRTPEGQLYGWTNENDEGYVHLEYRVRQDEPAFWITFFPQGKIVDLI